MDLILLGISISVLALLLTVYLYFLLRPRANIMNGEYGSSDPAYNPNAFPVGWKSPLNYRCLEDTDCNTDQVCDPYTYLCKIANGYPCTSQSVCQTTSFCNVVCYPNDTPVAYTSCADLDCSNVGGMLAPCPDPYESVFQGNRYICLKYAGAYCSKNSECSSGVCSLGVCKAGYELGHACNQNSDCGSLNCLNQYCQQQGIFGGGTDDSGYACGSGRNYYHCQSASTCINGFCRTYTSGLDGSCTIYNTAPPFVCYNFFDTIDKNGDTCVGCGVTACKEEDPNCNSSFYIDSQYNTNPNVFTGTCIQGMIYNENGFCLPGTDQPSDGVCSDESTLENIPRLYELRPIGNNYPLEGVTNALNLQYIPVNTGTLDLSKVVSFNVASYNYRSDGKSNSNTYELFLYFLEGDSSLYYATSKNPTSISFLSNTGNIAVTYRNINGIYTPVIFELNVSVYVLFWDGTTLTRGQSVYTPYTYFTYISAFYVYDANELETLYLYLSGSNKQGESIVVTPFTFPIKTVFPSGNPTVAYLTDYATDDINSVRLSYTSNDGIWGVYALTGGLPVLTFPKTSFPTEIFSMQPSSTNGFEYNNMVGITNVNGTFQVYYYSSGRSTAIPGYVDATTKVQVTPGKTYILVNKYCK